MENKLNTILVNHRQIASEVWHEINELSKIDTSKFTKLEQNDIKLSIEFLESELSLRKAFISELETLL